MTFNTSSQRHGDLNPPQTGLTQHHQNFQNFVIGLCNSRVHRPIRISDKRKFLKSLESSEKMSRNSGQVWITRSPSLFAKSLFHSHETRGTSEEEEREQRVIIEGHTTEPEYVDRVRLGSKWQLTNPAFQLTPWPCPSHALPRPRSPKEWHPQPSRPGPCPVTLPGVTWGVVQRDLVRHLRPRSCHLCFRQGGTARTAISRPTGKATENGKRGGTRPFQEFRFLGMNISVRTKPIFLNLI